MKRKLDANDIPSPDSAEAKEVKDADITEDFESLNLDPRLRQALVKEKFSKPTPVQAKAIPLALQGKDILGMFSWLYDFIVEDTDEDSACKNRLWQNGRICASDFANHSSEKSGS